MKRFALILSLSFVLFSCGIKPPDDLERTDILDMSEQVSKDIINFLNDFSAFDYLNASWIPNKGVFLIKKGDQILFNQNPWDIEQETETPYIFVSGPNGKVMLMQDVFLSETTDEMMLYSFDNKKWFATDGDPKEFENFYPMLNMDWEREKRVIEFTFDWAMREGANPKVEDFDSTDLPVIKLKPGMVIDDSEKNPDEINLRKKILFMPKGTLITINVLLDSNFLQFYKTDENTAMFTAIEDVHLYKKGWLLSASFDGSYWRDTFFAYRFGFNSSIKVNSEGEPVVEQGGYIINKKLLKRQEKAGKKVPFLSENH